VLLVERDDELAVLGELLGECREGCGRVVVLSGVTTSGKTALLHSFYEEAARSGALILGAAGSRVEQSLSMGVVEQLFVTSPAARDVAVDPSLLAPSTGVYQDEPASIEGDGQLSDLGVARELWAALLSLAQDRPLVLGIDDAHYADGASLQTLLYFARRSRASRVLIVLAELTHPRSVHPLFRAELLRQPHCRRIWLGPLSRCGVAEMVADRVEPDGAIRLAEQCHAISGGNPLFVKALIQDYWIAVKTGRHDEKRGLIPGDAYRDAVLQCLHRCDLTTFEVACSLTVLQLSNSGDLVDRFVGLRSEAVEPMMHILAVAGLTEPGPRVRFRHEAARSALIESLAPDTCVELHLRAARTLYEAGRSTTAVATHLVAAGKAPDGWALPSLQNAASEAIRDGNHPLAIAALELARDTCEDGQQRADITARLAHVQWMAEPYTTTPYSALLLDAFRAGHLSASGARTLVHALVREGAPDEAVAVLDTLRAEVDPANRQQVRELGSIQCAIAHLYPARLAELHRDLPNQRPHMPGRTDMSHQSVDSLAEVLLARPNDPQSAAEVFDDAVRNANVALRNHRPETDPQAVLDALLTMLYADIAVDVEQRCSAILAQEAMQFPGAPRALLLGARAGAALHLGQLRHAELLSAQALAGANGDHCTVSVGLPLAFRIAARTAMGQHTDDDDPLLQLNLPDKLFESLYGLHYLYARGQRLLSVGQTDAALREFRTCRDLMAQWSIDVPSVVPWRTGAAEALLKLDEPEQAAQLANEQLQLAAPGLLRTRGMAVRVLAGTQELRYRPERLRWAVDTLERSGDRYQTARALSDLADAYVQLGETDRARRTAMRAAAAADACGAEPLARHCRSLVAAEAEENEADLIAEMAAGLSDAERRVASLAAMGCSNREIGHRLFITVSTVEQHLTRVYRKLSVGGRADLAACFLL